ncbi:MAG: RNA-guided pseudouridylation complex pseudouridine synthase subunit Cbf5 [Candidatus Micrarchaeota archaeon]|nr:RNA-guided pseudouridylation complex pseudouridine synthase subunit Cbf5 [Candidatus Micrarchaeota archaeon]
MAHPELGELLKCSFLIVDKPIGPSSHEVTSFVRKMLGVKKAGHSGTLDPQVSGVLPVGVGKATRLLQYLAAKDKKYVCLMKTGRKMGKEEIEQLFESFTGTIVQTPPKESAVSKKPRQRKVFYIHLLQLQSTKVLFEVHCEAGTYIRVLVSDFAPHCGGAKMLELRRISVGPITESSAHTLQEISDAMWLAQEKRDESAIRKMLLPASEALSLPKMVLQDSAVESVCAGSGLYRPGLLGFDQGINEGEEVALMTRKGELVGVGRATASSSEITKMKSGCVASPLTIVMERGTYPRKW